MRVIAGTVRGFRLVAPPGDATRPTLDRVRETLFNILMPRLEDARFLDLFAGSGANGIEALSRGARFAAFVDKSPESIRAITENLNHTRLTDRAQVLPGDFLPVLQALGRQEPFDLIFLDPPYQAGLAEAALKAIVEYRLLAPEGWVIWERSAKMPLVPVAGLTVFREKSTRITTMTFMMWEDNLP